MSVLFRCSFKTAMLIGFLKVAKAMSNFMSKVYNGGFLPEFIVLMIKEVMALVWKYTYETRK